MAIFSLGNAAPTVLELKNSAQLPGANRGSFTQTTLEFLGALRARYTYSLRDNTEVLFGFLWGIPIPVFSVGIHLEAIHESISWDAVLRLIAQHPYHLLFALHPFIFATVFGAFGTMRARRDQRIAAAIEREHAHSEELATANARLRELDHIKDEFLANVTHELKSPLVTALGYSDRVLSGNVGALNDRQRHALQICHHSLVRLRNLIDEILDFEQLESGKVRLHVRSFDLRDTIAGLFESSELKAKDKNITLAEELPPGPLMLNADPEKIHQVLLNLMDNAIKFSGPGTEIRLTVKRENENWHITIVDQGPGIPAEILRTLFERFAQADASRARPHDGVGLGLVIAQSLVELHRGRLRLESEVGNGTAAHIVMPVGETDGKGKSL